MLAAALDAMLSAREREVGKLLTSLKSDLRDGLSVADALAITLALCVDAAYATLREAGWDGERYEKWLGDALVEQLLRA
jgi:phage major head subunit gpT-like protein